MANDCDYLCLLGGHHDGRGHRELEVPGMASNYGDNLRQ